VTFISEVKLTSCRAPDWFTQPTSCSWFQPSIDFFFSFPSLWLERKYGDIPYCYIFIFTTHNES